MKKKVFREQYNEEPTIVEIKMKPTKLKKITDFIEEEDFTVQYELKPKKTTKKKVGK